MRKFHPYAVAAAAAGKKIYHLNIGQPDIHTPDALYDAIHNFRTPVLAYAASPGIPELISAIEGYYRNIGVQLSESDILVTTGGSEALPMSASLLVKFLSISYHKKPFREPNACDLRLLKRFCPRRRGAALKLWLPWQEGSAAWRPNGIIQIL